MHRKHGRLDCSTSGEPSDHITVWDRLLGWTSVNFFPPSHLSNSFGFACKWSSVWLEAQGVGEGNVFPLGSGTPRLRRLGPTLPPWPQKAFSTSSEKPASAYNLKSQKHKQPGIASMWQWLPSLQQLVCYLPACSYGTCFLINLEKESMNKWWLPLVLIAEYVAAAVKAPKSLPFLQ